MNKCDTPRSEFFFGLVKASGNLFGSFNVIDFDVNHANAEFNARINFFQGNQIIIRAMGEFEHKVIGMQVTEKIGECAPGTALDGLPAVISKTKVNGFFSVGINRVEHRIDGSRCDRPILGIAWDIGFIDLHTGAWQVAHLIGQHIGHTHEQGFKIAVVIVEQGAGKHIGAGKRKFEGTACNGCSAQTVG